MVAKMLFVIVYVFTGFDSMLFIVFVLQVLMVIEDLARLPLRGLQR